MSAIGVRGAATRRAVAMAAVLASARTLAAQTSAPPPPASAGAEREAIVAEVRAFYRDVDATRWAAVLDHFLPAKVAARWAPPLAAAAWARPEPAVASAEPARSGSGASLCTDGGRAPERSWRVAVVGAWARLVAPRCTGAGDELWLLRVSGRWKIVHLERGKDVGEIENHGGLQEFLFRDADGNALSVVHF